MHPECVSVRRTRASASVWTARVAANRVRTAKESVRVRRVGANAPQTVLVVLQKTENTVRDARLTRRLGHVPAKASRTVSASTVPVVRKHVKTAPRDALALQSATAAQRVLAAMLPKPDRCDLSMAPTVFILSAVSLCIDTFLICLT
ncbi:putative mitochondrial protein [Andalucia godoyi]|uniref:Putative mitochondrial protein n=1 Tax=Andalucia godoyi TaxID=505711 RepID=A0A8K0AGT0_ANDGO|nr:putative mitochondrial protein [Andalucia godoyi]|eukprot:ANDGO_08221.mRNA.1 putative mitochondrial protein